MDNTNIDERDNPSEQPERKSSPDQERSEGGIEMGLGQPGPTDEEAEGDGNGEAPFRNTPVSPNANR